MFEVGKTYRTRGGGTARVEYANKDGSFIIRHDDYQALTHFGTGVWSGGTKSAHDLLPGAIEDAAPVAETPRYSVGVSPAMPSLDAPVKTLRDEYAMAALTGMLSRSPASTNVRDNVRISCDYADAMMAERSRRMEGK